MAASERSRPALTGARVISSPALHKAGLVRTSRVGLQEAHGSKDSTISMLSLLAYAYARSGKRTEAQHIISDLEEGSSKHSAHTTWHLPISLGDHDMAFASLEEDTDAGIGSLLPQCRAAFEPLYADPTVLPPNQAIGLPADACRRA